jgi:tetratricopeptide (TPR) repeat protein
VREVWCWLAGSIVACGGSRPAPLTTSEKAVPSAAAVVSATAPRALEPAPEELPASETSSAANHAIEWYRDDPDAALARARSEKKLVVVDLWAAWCHTCLSMRQFVLTDAKLPGVGARFVFLSIDTELAKNADFLSRFPTSGWPTFYVLAPDGPSVRGRWLGAASPGQFARFLADAEHADASTERTGASTERAVTAPGSGASTRASANDPMTLLAAAGALAAERRYAEAAQAYRAALECAPRDWPRAPDVRVALASALLRANDPSACVELVLAAPPIDTRAPISASDLAASALDCAERLPPSDDRRKKARERAASDLAPLCERGDLELAPDDRGDACGNLMAAREALGDAQGARRAAETRLSVLENAAHGMPDDVALIYDPARSETLLALGRGEEALALLQARAAALPDNYNPPYYVARVALKLGRWELGLAAAERALTLAYGPRRANVYALKADLLLGAGRKRDAIAALKAQIATLVALPEGQKRPEAEKGARERLAMLERHSH